MCFTNTPEIDPPAPPPEVLKQAAPDKKTAAEPSRSSQLSIGTKKYRNTNGLSSPGTRTTTPPSGITL